MREGRRDEDGLELRVMEEDMDKVESWVVMGVRV